MRAKRKKILTDLRQYLEPRVKFAFVFGSILTDYFKEESDVDVAVFLGQPLDSQARLEMQEELSELLGPEHEADLVLLDRADPIIAMQVLTKGELIVNNDEMALVLYKVRMWSEYIDFKMDRKIIEDRILEGSIHE